MKCLLNTCHSRKVFGNANTNTWRSQRSVLDPLSFIDLLLFIQNLDICNYGDDIKIYACSKKQYDITHELENDFHVAL